MWPAAQVVPWVLSMRFISGADDDIVLSVANASWVVPNDVVHSV